MSPAYVGAMSCGCDPDAKDGPHLCDRHAIDALERRVGALQAKVILLTSENAQLVAEVERLQVSLRSWQDAAQYDPEG